MSFIQGVPDVAKEKSETNLPIDSVGIQGLKMPIHLTSQITNLATISLFVSLDDKTTRGIHMSRLYLILHEYFSKNTLSFLSLKKILLKAIKAQKGISKSGKILVKSHWPVLRKALKSSIKGWREYPFFFELNYSIPKNNLTYIAGGEVLYSSTCPCSASLSRQIIKKDFEKKILKKKALKKKDVLNYLENKNFLTATPHAQKSKVFFKLKVSEKSQKFFDLIQTVDEIEQTLGTPVQTAVKREDEAEFAKANASHLMFCEDACRKIAFFLNKKKHILDYVVRTQHYESLHPFTVESSIVKGVKEGWKV